MRLVLAAPLYPPEPGGPATYAKHLFEGLPSRGIEVNLVLFSEVRRYSKATRHLRYFTRLLKATRKADAVLALDPVSTGLPAVLAALLCRRPFFLKVGGDYAWEQGTQRFGLTHSLDAFLREKEMPLPVALLQFLQRFVAKRARMVIVPSYYLSGVIGAWGVPETRRVVIENAVDLPKAGTVDASVASSSVPRIVSIGRLVPWKGMRGLLIAAGDAASRTPLSVVIVGDGPERAKLEAFAANVLPGRAIFTGALPNADAVATLRLARAYVLNSSYEGLPHTLIEALFAGIPVIATDAGGNREVVESGVNGLLVPVGDREALSSAMEKLLTDDALHARLSEGAKESAKRFSSQKMLDAAAMVFFNAMKALFVSNDPALFHEGSAVRARMLTYAKAIGELHILSRAERVHGPLEDGPLTLHPLHGGKIAALLRMKQEAIALIQRHGIEVVSAQDPFELGYLAMKAAEVTGIPLHLQIHTDFLSPWFVRSGVFRAMQVQVPFLNRFRLRLADRVLPRASGIRVVSERIKASLAARYKEELAPVEVLPIAVSAEEVPVSPLPTPQFAFSLITVGRLEPEKRIEDILMALGRIARLFPSVGLYVVGAGRERYRLELLAKKLGLFSRVIFLGERSDARGLMRTASAYIQASAYEGYGMALVEAALARIPIITTDVGIVGEVFRGYEDVLSAPPGDPAALALHINELVGDHQARLRLVMSAEHTVRNHLATIADTPARFAESLVRLTQAP